MSDLDEYCDSKALAWKLEALSESFLIQMSVETDAMEGLGVAARTFLSPAPPTGRSSHRAEAQRKQQDEITFAHEFHPS
ncbi:unnamed protein product [Jaminaea pallidilutea]